jgi:hypothetical protein
MLSWIAAAFSVKTNLTAGRNHKHNTHTAENGGFVQWFNYFSTVDSPQRACQGYIEGCYQALIHKTMHVGTRPHT